MTTTQSPSSEETGAISIAEFGKLGEQIPRDDFRETLAARLAAPAPGPEEDREETAAGAAEAGDDNPDEKRAA